MKKHLFSFLFSLFLCAPDVQARTIDDEETGKKTSAFT